jgi:hypothetical protein
MVEIPPTRSRTDDLIDRLTSRKFLLCLFVIVLGLVGFATGHLTYDQLLTGTLTAIGIFSGMEGLADAASALRPRPTPDTQIVTTSTSAPADVEAHA